MSLTCLWFSHITILFYLWRHFMLAIQLLSEAGPDMSLAWLLWVALGFFFLMVVVGWAVSKRQ